jgi:hypothetical protein
MNPDLTMLSDSQKAQYKLYQLQKMMETAMFGNGTINPKVLQHMLKEADIKDAEKMLVKSSPLKEELKKLL